MPSDNLMKPILQSSLSGGINFQILEHLCDILYGPIPTFVFQDSEGLGRNGIFHHDQVFDANVSMKIAILDQVEPPY